MPPLRDSASSVPLPPGINEKLAGRLFGDILQGTTTHGYNKQTHFRKFLLQRHSGQVN